MINKLTLKLIFCCIALIILANQKPVYAELAFQLDNPKKPETTIKGKNFTFRGVIGKGYSIYLNGEAIYPDRSTNRFEKNVSIDYGTNWAFYFSVRNSRGKEIQGKMVSITRNLYDCEKEYFKAFRKELVLTDFTHDDFDIDSLDNKLVVVNNYAPTIVILNEKVWKTLSNIPENLGYSKAITFSIDDQHVFIGDYYHSKNHLIDLKENSYETVFGCESSGFRVDVDRKNNLFFSASNGLCVMNAKELNQQINIGPGNIIYPFKVSPDSNYLLTTINGGINLRLIPISELLKILKESQQISYADINERIDEVSRILSLGGDKFRDETRIGDFVFKNNNELVLAIKKGILFKIKINQDGSFSMSNKTDIGRNINRLGIINDFVVVGSSDTLQVFDYDDFSFKGIFYLNDNVEKIILSRKYENTIYVSTGTAIYKMIFNLQNIDWNLMNQYIRLKEEGVI